MAPTQAERRLALVTLPDGALGYARRWAGGRIHADRPWPGFAVAPAHSLPLRANVAEKDGWTTSGEAWLAGALRRFVVAATTGRLRVVVENVVAFRLDVPAGRIDLLDGDADSALAADVLLGTALALDLAAHDMYALDGAAVADARGAVVIAGARNSGRSTLAQALAALPAWTRVADSTVALARDGTGPVVRTQFPQWHATPVWPALDADTLALRAVLVLAHGPVWRLEPLDRAQALKTFLAGTGAAPLFPPRIHEAQLAFGADLVRGTRWLRLSVPDYTGRLDRLPDEAAHALEALP